MKKYRMIGVVCALVGLWLAPGGAAFASPPIPSVGDVIEYETLEYLKNRGMRSGKVTYVIEAEDAAAGKLRITITTLAQGKEPVVTSQWYEKSGWYHSSGVHRIMTACGSSAEHGWQGWVMVSSERHPVCNFEVRDRSGALMRRYSIVDLPFGIAGGAFRGDASDEYEWIHTRVSAYRWGASRRR